MHTTLLVLRFLIFREAQRRTGSIWEGFTAEMTFSMSSQIVVHKMKRERIFKAEGQCVQKTGMWRWAVRQKVITTSGDELVEGRGNLEKYLAIGY